MEFVGSVKSDSFLLGPGMLINYLQANENDLLNLTAFSPKFSSSPSGKGERNAIVKTWLKVRGRAGEGRAGWDVSFCSYGVLRFFIPAGWEGLGRWHGWPL